MNAVTDAQSAWCGPGTAIHPAPSDVMMSNYINRYRNPARPPAGDRQPPRTARRPWYWVLFLGLAASATAAEIYVAPDGTAQAPYDSPTTGLQTIQAALTYAAANDTIRVMAGTYPETLSVGKSVSLVGQGMTSTTVNAGSAGSCVTVTTPAQITLTDLRLQNGRAEYGGGLHIGSGSAALTRVRISECTAGRGGGIYAESATLTMTDCLVDDCVATTQLGTNGGKGGGLYLVYSPFSTESTFTGTTFRGNQAVYGGAVRFWQGRAVLRQCQFFLNRAEQTALDATEFSDVTAVDGLLHHNQALYSSVAEITGDSDATFCYLTATENDSRFGGQVLYADVYGDLAIWNSAFQRNAPDASDVNPGTTFVGNVFSTIPTGVSGSAQNGTFAAGADGDYYLAAAPQTPSVFIGAGSADCPVSVTDSTRKCFVTGPAAASPPNAGYGYPLQAEGKLHLSLSPSFALGAQGVTYLTYTLESADDPGFTAGVGASEIGPLAPAAVTLGVAAPGTDRKFYRMKGAAPVGRTATFTVQNSSRAPLAGIPVDLFEAASLAWRGAGLTGANGSCSVADLPPGSYTALAGWGGQTYVPMYLGDTTDAGAATVFSLSTPSATFAGTITLASGASITGTVTAGAAPLAGASVAVYDASRAVVNSATTAADGTFRVGGLAAGAYTLSAEKAPQHATVYWRNAATADAAELITLTTQQTKTANISLIAYPRITGTVSAPAGEDLFAIVVVLYQASGYQEVTYAFADANGAYSLYGPVGTYIVSAGEGSGLVVGYSDSIQLLAGATVGNVDFSLAYGGTIAGAVVDNQQTPVADLYVDFYVNDGQGNLTWANGAITDESGEYESPVLPPGTYYIQAYGDPSYSSPWYLNATYPENALAVPLAAHDEITGINFQVSPLQ